MAISINSPEGRGGTVVGGGIAVLAVAAGLFLMLFFLWPGKPAAAPAGVNQVGVMGTRVSPANPLP